jgi:hypothetical protein
MADGETATPLRHHDVGSSRLYPLWHRDVRPGQGRGVNVRRWDQASCVQPDFSAGCDQLMCAQPDENGPRVMLTAQCLIAKGRKVRLDAHRLIVRLIPEDWSVRSDHISTSLTKSPVACAGASLGNLLIRSS